MKTLVVLITIITTASICKAYSPDNCAKNEAYVQKYKKIAVIEMHKSGIPASIKLAQGILESAAGTSELARKANNHFGIKCGGDWKGKTFYRKDDDYKFGKKIKSCFRGYKNPEASFTDHTKFLTNPAKNSRYGFLFKYKKTDYKKWAKGLKKAGYATNPRYPELLIKVIEDNNLHQFDYFSVQEVLEGNEDEKILADNAQDETLPAVTPGKDLDAPSKPSYKQKNNSKSNTTKKQNERDRNATFVVNDIKAIKTQMGDTPSKIAKRHNTSKSKILKYNDLSGLETLEIGTNIFLQPKRNSFRGKKNFHVVEENEKMYAISQKYGIKLSKLYKRNNMNPGQEPLDGEHINLRGKRFKTPKLKKSEEKQTEKKKEADVSKTKANQPSKTFPAKEKKERKEKSKDKIHVVKSGETLYRIAKQHNVSVDDIKKWNRLKNNTIEIGQKLIIKK